jgi:hypothetical protein
MNAGQIKTYFEKLRQAETEEEKEAFWAEIRLLVSQESVGQRREGINAIRQRLREIHDLLSAEKVTH